MDQDYQRKIADKDNLIHNAYLQLSNDKNIPVKIHELNVNKKSFFWSNDQEKIELIRNRLPYGAIESISDSSNIPIKHYLHAMEISQTTYNNKKREKSKLSKQESELIIALIELFDYGLMVFNNEKEKFQNWLKKTNAILGNISPISLFDSLTGINEVKKILNRIEYGNMA